MTSFAVRSVFASFLLISSLAQAAQGNLRKVTFATGYIPNVQFTPFYLAAAKGYFQKEGLEVDFNYAMGAEPLKLVAQGKYEFGTADGDALFAAVASGLELVSIFQLYQKNPISVYALTPKRLDSLSDLAGKKVGIAGLYGASFVGWKVASHKRPELAKAKLQVIGYTQVAALLSGHVDAAIGYSNNEAVVLERRGHKVKVFPLSEVAWLPGNGVVTSAALAKKEPKLARGFVAALKKGLEDTLAKPDESFDLIRAKYLPEVKGDDQLSEQRAVLKATLDLWRADSKSKLGGHDHAKLEDAQKVLLETKIIQKPIDIKKTFPYDFQ